jgi:hypothetical protein
MTPTKAGTSQDQITFPEPESAAEFPHRGGGRFYSGARLGLHGKPTRQRRFSVPDNRIGIEAEYKERIFGTFKRRHTREEYAGSGIGQAICKRTV